MNIYVNIYMNQWLCTFFIITSTTQTLSTFCLWWTVSYFLLFLHGSCLSCILKFGWCRGSRLPATQMIRDHNMACSTGHAIKGPACHSLFQQQWRAFENEAEYEKPSLQWTSVLRHHFLLSLQARAVTRNWQGKKRRAAKRGCSVFGIFREGPWCNYNHIWPSQWAGDETDVSKKKWEA